MSGSTIRAVLITATTMYLGLGLFLGSAMAAHIPAMNWRGVAYYTVTWPAFVASGTLNAPAPPVPFWCFTFSEKAR